MLESLHGSVSEKRTKKGLESLHGSNDVECTKKVEIRDSDTGIDTCWGSSYDFGCEEPAMKAQRSDFSKTFTLEGAMPTVEQSNLDSRAVLKAFRLIGGINGIQIEELRQRISTVRAEHVRKPLLKIIDAIFAAYDADCNGFLDVLEFENLVNSSTILQEAVYDILATVNNEEAARSRSQEVPKVGECLELVSISIVFLYILCVAAACDNMPDWYGWRIFELVFVCLFTVDICVRFARDHQDENRHLRFSEFSNFFKPSPTASASVFTGRTYSRKDHPCVCVQRIRFFFVSPTNLLDLFATICGWVNVCIIFLDMERSTHNYIWVVQQLRWARLVRLLRLVHFMTYFRECGVLLIGLLSGIQSVMWGLTLSAMVVLVWAVTIRQYLENQDHSDGAAILLDIFPSMPRSMHIIFRCMVLRADSSCVHKEHGPIFDLLSTQLGWFSDFMWLVSEVFLCFVVFNVIAATFVMQAAENAKQLQESIHNSLWRKDEVRLQSLDRLLRTLIYPGREEMCKTQSNPKDQYAAQVTRMIQKEHPEAAARIPNLEKEVVNFARCIQESKSLLQNAMNRYEAREQTACRNLQNTPSAKTYLESGEEALLVDKNDASISNALGIPAAPMSAVEVVLVQETDTFNDLLQEAEEVQQYVKSKICPQSTWAMTPAAGYSGDIRKNSNRLCDEALDPGIKDAARIDQKVLMKYNGRYECNRDYSRLGLIYNSVANLMEALPLFLKLNLASEGVRVASIENRFVHPHPLGWRDITVLLQVRVPSSGRHHIMEVQMMLRGLTECRNASHHFYEEIRGLLPQDVVMTILDRLVTDTTLDLGITHNEWLQCLHNKEVKQLLDELGVPANCRRRLFDIVDIDDSGTVASSELQEMLRLFRTPAQALELAGCHFRVREVQRNVQTKLGPQLTKLHKHVISIGSMLQDILRTLIESHAAEKVSGSYTKLSLPILSATQRNMPADRLADAVSAWMADVNVLTKVLQDKLAGSERKTSRAKGGDLAKKTPVRLPARPHPSTPLSAVGEEVSFSNSHLSAE